MALTMALGKYMFSQNLAMAIMDIPVEKLAMVELLCVRNTLAEWFVNSAGS
jgi:hypothetical protein